MPNFFETGAGLVRAMRISFWGMAITMVLAVAPCALGGDERELGGSDPVYSGLYVSDHGSRIVVYAPSNSLEVIMDYTSTVESPMMLYLRGEKSNLIPYSVRSTAHVGGQACDLLFNEDAILAGSGRSARYLRRSAEGFVSKDAPDESSREEAELTLRDYDDMWSRLRRVRVRLTSDVLEIRNSENAPLPNAVFKRQAPLEDEAVSTFEAAVKARVSGLTDIEDLVKPSK